MAVEATLAGLPHHDGSSLYVSDSAPSLGQSVRLRVRVPRPSRLSEVHVRTVEDGQEMFRPASQEPRSEPRSTQPEHGEDWWSVEVIATNPVTRYRFLLIDSLGTTSYLTASGVRQHDVTDAEDFRLCTYQLGPEWAAAGVVYEIFPDRFSRSGLPLTPEEVPPWGIACAWDTDEPAATGHLPGRQVYGGNLDGVADRLDHMRDLGVNTLYLRPVFEATSSHRYDASSFARVDPLVGGRPALERLAARVHQDGMHLLGDLTTNHCGDAHEWFKTASADPESAERSMFYFNDDGTYACWFGVPTLPKLRWDNPVTTDRMTSAAAMWMDYYDGWRIDVANQTGRYGALDVTRTVARELKAAILARRPDSTLVAEHMFDASADLDDDGWDATMAYSGFTRPVWAWLRGEDVAGLDFIGVPGGIPHRDGIATMNSIRAFSASTSWSTYVRSWLPLDSYDVARIRTVVGTSQRHAVAAGLQATLPGVPMICAGSEFALEGTTGEHARTPMPWNRPRDRDLETLEVYRALFTLRATEPALMHGGRDALAARRRRHPRLRPRNQHLRPTDSRPPRARSTGTTPHWPRLEGRLPSRRPRTD